MPAASHPRRALLASFLLLAAAAAVVAASTGTDGIPPEVYTDDPAHGNVRMGIKSDGCDNGETNLSIDWDGISQRPFACTRARRRAFATAAAAAAASSHPAVEFSLSEPEQPQRHVCSNRPIHYRSRLPTGGPHRPLWPVWGRYSYVPVQRWLHSLEHGGIVGLHHPCAPAGQVAAFQAAVAGCLRRHVLATDGERVTVDRPFVLLAYRNKVLMSQFEPNVVKEFIEKFALRGPERLSLDGQYSLGLLERAQTVSDEEDSQLCPAG